MLQASNGTQLELARGTIIRFPRWSPDGSELLFNRYDELYKTEPTSKNAGVFVVSRLGGIARPIFKATHACWFAPDGSDIVTATRLEPTGFNGVRLVKKLTGEAKEIPLSKYTSVEDIDCSARAGSILVVVVASNKSQLRTFKPDGSDERNLIESSDEYIYSGRWSPTGDSIYYLHGKGSTQELSKISVTRGHPEPEGVAEGLQTDGFFTLSADASRLAYTRGERNSNLWRVDPAIAGKRVKPEISQVTTGTSFYSSPSFSPDGRWITFDHGPSLFERNIFKMQLPAGEPVQLTFFKDWAVCPAWSPDGQRIAFVADQNGVAKVWIISTNGGTAQPLENTNVSDSDRLAWWPHSEIVYSQPGDQNFLKVNEKTHEEKPVIPPDESARRESLRREIVGKPIFSSDGKKMAVYWNREPVGLWVSSLEPYSENLLLSGANQPIGWSPDGKYVYAVEESGREIMRVQVDSPHEVTPVATLPGRVGPNADDASISPDGKQIVVSISEQKSDVWLMENFDPSPR
jgi:Tol biopolymer transport system component